jgi:hypothetical protein
MMDMRAVDRANKLGHPAAIAALNHEDPPQRYFRFRVKWVANRSIDSGILSKVE